MLLLNGFADFFGEFRDFHIRDFAYGYICDHNFVVTIF